MGRTISNPASALGEAVGRLIETDLSEAVRSVAEMFGHSVRPMALRNHLGNRHQIDTVVSDDEGRPIILLEHKYLRYKKHNWDKGSRLCIAHYSLRRSFPSIRKSIGVLAGEWTDSSLKFIQSFGVETYRIPFEHVADVLEGHGIAFRWEEKDALTPRKSWEDFCRLSGEKLGEMASELTEPIRSAVQKSVEVTLRSGPDIPKRVEDVELSIRTSEGEYLVYSFGSISDAIQHLLTFLRDVEDLRRILPIR